MWKKQMGLGLLAIGLSSASQADIVYFQDFSSGLNSNESLQIGSLGGVWQYQSGSGNLSASGLTPVGPSGKIGSVYNLRFSNPERVLYSGNVTVSADVRVSPASSSTLAAVATAFGDSASEANYLPITNISNVGGISNLDTFQRSSSMSAPGISPFNTWDASAKSAGKPVMAGGIGSTTRAGTVFFDLTDELDAGTLDTTIQIGLFRFLSFTAPTNYTLDNVTITVDNVTVPNPAILSLFGLGLLGLVTQRRLTRKP